uniref:HNH nuclease domain-containing protein n=1 Tax=viral metagenome TaxID=1070528 RepID=A0A6C0L2Z6_9ZZZZ
MDQQICSKCKKTLPVTSYTMKKNNEYFKTCDACRIKRPVEKEDPEEEKKTRRESRPTISSQKQQIILKEQNYKCRGPGKNDNTEYECDMNVNGKSFSDKKASEPQFDHIVRWKEGGNGLENIQALCASCHLMKTSMENIIQESPNCPSHRVKTILSSLSRSKYIEHDSDSSDEEIDFILTRNRFRRR